MARSAFTVFFAYFLLLLSHNFLHLSASHAVVDASTTQIAASEAAESEPLREHDCFTCRLLSYSGARILLPSQNIEVPLSQKVQALGFSLDLAYPQFLYTDLQRARAPPAV